MIARHRSSIARALAAALVAASVAGPSCATNPATGGKQIALVSESQEKQMGQQADQEVAAAIGLYEDADLQAYVRSIGAELAGRLGAVSADHLLCVTEAGVEALARAGTVATLLPGTAFFLGLSYAPARRLIGRGVAVALASDCNPGTCMTENLPLVGTMACTQMKMLPAEVLTDVVRMVHAGHRYVDPQLAAEAISAGASPLTPREADVLALAADGTPIEEVARRAALSAGTVRNYLSSAAGKLDVANRHEAARKARSLGWI